MSRLIALLAMLIPLAAQAAEAPLFPGLVQERLLLPVALPDGRTVALDAMVLRPDRPGRFPLALLIHGTPRSGTQDPDVVRGRMSPELFLGPATVFAERGYAAVAVLRRGFGRSGGGYAERSVGQCGNTDPLLPARASGEDVAAAAASLRRQAWVDPARLLLVGISTGGVAVSAAASGNPPGVLGVLDFAGGRGSPAADQVCSPGRLVDAMGAFGRTARVPALWLYAENDHFFGPELARRMFDAYSAGGAPAQLRMLPPFGADGHNLLMAAPEDLWWPAVAGFLETLGLPTRIVIALPPLPPLPPPAILNGGCRAGFAAFVARRSATKAFVSSPSGACGWQFYADTAEESQARAMEACSRVGTGCRVYASGHRLAEP